VNAILLYGTYVDNLFSEQYREKESWSFLLGEKSINMFKITFYSDAGVLPVTHIL